MKRPTLNRRTLLRGMLGGSAVAIGLPALEIFLNSHGTAYADDGPGASGFPKRFGLFFWGNGVLPDRWVPADDGPDWELSEQLMPLAHLRDWITVVTGMRLGVPNTAPHWAGAAGILSAAPVEDAYGDNTFAGPSIDQIIAEKVGEFTRFRSLEFGAEPGAGLSFNGPNSRNPPETSPLALFTRIFGGNFQLPGEEPIVDPNLALRRSVLDAVMSDLGGLKQRLGQPDRIRLEQHTEGLRSLEKRLARLEEDPPNLVACQFPAEPLAEYPDIEGRPQLHEKNEAFAQIVAMAMACDQTRVFSNFFTKPLTNHLFPDAPAGHHQLTHDEPGAQPAVNAITLHCIQALGAQIEALKNVAEGEGSLLDNCAVLGTSEVSLGKTHSLENFPLVVAGSCGGKLKTGLHIRANGENASKLLLTLCRATGMDLAELGTAGAYTAESLTAVEA